METQDALSGIRAKITSADRYKGGVLRGSEKQIDWAKDIITNVINCLEWGVVESEKEDNEFTPYNVSNFNERIERLKTDGLYAGDVIAVFGNIRFTGDKGEDFDRIVSAYRTASLVSDGVRFITLNDGDKYYKVAYIPADDGEIYSAMTTAKNAGEAITKFIDSGLGYKKIIASREISKRLFDLFPDDHIS